MSERELRDIVIVSITPMPIRSDSRTLKQASSVTRLGYRSIAVEGPASGLDPASLNFELVSSLPTLKPAAPMPAGALTSPPLPTPFAPSQARLASAPTTSRLSRLVMPHQKVASASCAPILWITAWVPTWPILFAWSALGIAVSRIRSSAPVQSTYHVAKFACHVADFFGRYMLAPLRVMPKAALYYLHAFYQFPAVWLLCWRHGAKFVYDAHDYYAQLEREETLSPFWRDWVRPFEDWIERKCVSRAAAVVTVNEGIADLLRKRFGCDAVVLRNSHDRRLDTKVSRTIRDVTGVGESEFLLVSVGQWKPGRAVLQAIEAFVNLPSRYHLAFVGPGYPSHDALLAEKALTGRVHFLPPVKPTEVVPFISTADAGVTLYHASAATYLHSSPNGFFQSVAAGIAVLYPRLPEMERLGERYGLGVSIDATDPRTLTAALLKLGENPELYRQIRTNVRNAQFELSWERDEQVLRKLIESFMEHRSMVSHAAERPQRSRTEARS